MQNATREREGERQVASERVQWSTVNSRKTSEDHEASPQRAADEERRLDDTTSKLHARRRRHEARRHSRPSRRQATAFGDAVARAKIWAFARGRPAGGQAFHRGHVTIAVVVVIVVATVSTLIDIHELLVAAAR